MAKITESKIIELIRREYGSENVIRFAPGVYSVRGIPDIYIAPVGLWIEIKIGRTQLTVHQADFLDRVNEDNAGLLVAIKDNRYKYYTRSRRRIDPGVLIALSGSDLIQDVVTINIIDNFWELIRGKIDK